MDDHILRIPAAAESAPAQRARGKRKPGNPPLVWNFSITTPSRLARQVTGYSLASRLLQ